MKQLRPQIREFIGNAGEAQVLQPGNAWISMAYSGDIFILNNSGSPDIKFVVPEEGRETNGRACGADGARSTRSWTPLRRSGRPRPQW